MAGSEYYDHTTYPSQGAAGSSAAMRSELGSVENGFGKLPGLAGNGGKIVVVNAGGTALEATSTPVLGVATLTSANKVAITAPATAATLALAEGSTLATSGAFSQTLTATAATNVTLPTTGTLATLAGAETLTNKTLTSPAISSPTGITATNISNTPAGGISATTVQAALNELDTEKAALAGANFTGALQEGGKQIYNRGNILGTVSQTAGVPTGAVVERGSNANGEYVRFADGTQICTVKIAGPLNISNLTGSVYHTGSAVWNFPAAYVAAPAVQGMGDSVVGFCWVALGASAPSTTQTTFDIFAAVSTASTPVASLLAVGRWF